MTDQYDAFASDYHWLYSDHVLSGEPFIDRYSDMLSTLAPGAEILDCACGIGVHSLALSRHGYSVKGSDASRGMVDEASRRAEAEGLDVEFTACSWADLPGEFTEEFDVLFCYGNAIGHCRNEEEMAASLHGMREVLKKGGTLVIDSRNWEKVNRERPRFQTMRTRVRDGNRCLPLYVWNFPPEWHEAHVIELVLLFEKEDHTDIRCYPITYFPFRHADLVARLEKAEFKDIESDFDEAEDSYCVIARKG